MELPCQLQYVSPSHRAGAASLAYDSWALILRASCWSVLFLNVSCTELR
jgi:hypothetical protein